MQERTALGDRLDMLKRIAQELKDNQELIDVIRSNTCWVKSQSFERGK